MATAEQLITENLGIWSSAAQTKSAAGRGKANKLELYGIKKLRELILELAVRGLLVSQDSNDEPASELLKRVAAEKAQLVKDKKIKKPKALPAIEDDEKPFSVPNSWEWARLGEIQEFTNGYAFKSADLHDGPGVGVVKIGDVYRDKGIAEDKMQFVSEATADEAGEKFQISPGDLVITMTGDVKLGFNTSEKTYLLNQRVGKIRCFSVDSKYVYLRLVTVAEQKIEEASGGVIPNVSTTEINVTLISLPPLEEQSRIVAKVDELMALCDQLEQQQEASITAQQTLVQTLLDVLTTASERDGFAAAWNRIADHFDTLFTTEWSINQLRQTILQLAVMGKLVPQDPNDEPASELLKKIAAEKAQLVNDKKIKKPKVLPAIEDSEKPFELPSSWEWVRLGSVVDVASSKRIHVSDYVSEGVPFFRSKEIGELQRGESISTDLFISREKFESLMNTSGFPREDDLMLTSVGSIGNTWLCDGREFYYKDGNITKIGRSQYLSMRFVQDFISSPLFGYQVIETVSGTAYSALTIVKLTALKFALPPLNEQRRIVAKVDELMALCDPLRTRLNIAQSTQLHLADAVAASGLE